MSNEKAERPAMDKRKLKAFKAKERKDFEAWLSRINGHKFSADDRRKDGQYYSIAYENAWQGWIARALKQAGYTED